MKSCPSGTTGCNGKKRPARGETWVPYLLSRFNVSDCMQQEVGPVEHNRTVGVTAVIEQRHTGEKKKKENTVAL